jgi:hypothetical protein
MISRRDFLKNTITGLTALVLTDNSPAQAQQPQFNPNDYRIGYEEWKTAKDAYSNWNNEKDKNKKEKLKEILDNVNLRATAKRISENEPYAYSTFSQQEKRELNKFYRDHKEIIETMESPPTKPGRDGPSQQIGENTANTILFMIFAPLSLILTPQREAYLKEIYGRDINIKDKRPNLTDGIILYWDQKHQKVYDIEYNKNKRQ